MQKAIFFFLVLAVLLLVSFTHQTEGFQNLMGVSWTSKNDGTPPSLYTDLKVKQPGVVGLAEAGVGNIQPSPPKASDLPTAPFYQRAKETPSPYINPSTQPAKYIQLLGVKEDLQAFFGFQAQVLEEQSDPAIQIPLTRARADMGELIDIQSVIERNPGLPSRITNKQLDDIRSNLRYLRDVLHDLETSGAVQPEALEGFEDQVNTEKRATLKELQEFQIKVVVEITRLQASGTSDPVIQGRLNTLSRIKNETDDVITQIQNGSLTPETVPIYSSDIQKALPILGNPTDPLPSILKENNLPPAIASLFPGGMSPSDTEQSLQMTNIVKGYMKNLFEGASWGVNVMFKYDNPNVLKLQADAAKDSGPQKTYAESLKDSDAQPMDPYSSTVSSAETLQSHPSNYSYTTGLPGTSSRVQHDQSHIPSGNLDWKKRSQQISDQIRRRGLNPSDFGVLSSSDSVSDEFSWRGHVQMVCSRLNATTDPGLSETVGCPPRNWAGWRT